MLGETKPKGKDNVRWIHKKVWKTNDQQEEESDCHYANRWYTLLHIKPVAYAKWYELRVKKTTNELLKWYDKCFCCYK